MNWYRSLVGVLLAAGLVLVGTGYEIAGVALLIFAVAGLADVAQRARRDRRLEELNAIRRGGPAQ